MNLSSHAFLWNRLGELLENFLYVFRPKAHKVQQLLHLIGVELISELDGVLAHLLVVDFQDGRSPNPLVLISGDLVFRRGGGRSVLVVKPSDTRLPDLVEPPTKLALLLLPGFERQISAACEGLFTLLISGTGELSAVLRGVP